MGRRTSGVAKRRASLKKICEERKRLKLERGEVVSHEPGKSKEASKKPSTVSDKMHFILYFVCLSSLSLTF